MPTIVEYDLDGSLVGSPRKAAASRVRVQGRLYASTDESQRILKEDRAARQQFIDAARSFRAFLDYWSFLDQETGQTRRLGSSLWPAQQILLDAIETEPWLYALKARQLGETTLAVAFDAWVLRFRDPSARVHVFSTGDTAAKEVLENALFGLERLPATMRLPLHSTTRSIELDTGAKSRALMRSYPSTRAASRGSTCNHLHLDEWSAQVDPAKVYQATAPTVAPGGTFHILTTETVGPESDTAAYYRQCEAGDGRHTAIFVSALERPDRDEVWLEGQRRSMTRDAFRREYPTSADEALEASGDRYFPSELIDLAISPVPPRLNPFDKSYKYAAGVDIAMQGRDSTVITVLRFHPRWRTTEVVHYVRLAGPSKPSEVRYAIEEVYRLYPKCFFLVEDNAMGFTIRHDLMIPEYRLEGFSTSGTSKPRLISQLYSELDHEVLKWSATEYPQLTKEMRGYRIPDESITQDSVISLALAVEAVTLSYQKESEGGRILPCGPIFIA